MPICLDPNDTFEVALASDKEKPVAIRPVFIVKAQSMREHRSLLKALDEIVEKTVDEAFNQTLDLLGQSVTGWHNIPGECNRDGLESVLTFNEARELLRRVAFNAHLEPEEKKSSES